MRKSFKLFAGFERRQEKLAPWSVFLWRLARFLCVGVVYDCGSIVHRGGGISLAPVYAHVSFRPGSRKRFEKESGLTRDRILSMSIVLGYRQVSVLLKINQS